MVARVVGEVNGQSIIFEIDEKGSWNAAVPFQEDGEWVISLYAYDDAGNMAFVTRILYAISGHELTIKVLDKGYKGRLEELGINGFLDANGCSGGLEERGYAGNVEDDGFTSELEDNDYEGDVEDRGFIGSLVNCSDKHKDGGI